MAANPPDPPPRGNQWNIDRVEAQRDVVLTDRFEQHIHVPQVGSQDWRNRQVMLKRVRETWIGGPLDHSLAEATRLELGLHAAPDAVTDPRRLWRAEVAGPRTPCRRELCRGAG